MTTPSYDSRLARFSHELEQQHISISRLRSLAEGGIPESPGLRPTVWKLLLGYLAPDRRLWDKALAHKRSTYAQFCQELIINPSAAQTQGPPGYDHPLSTHTDSQWHAFFQDAEVREQIERDVMRTHPDMHFFSGDDPPAMLHRAEMQRALFIFAKLNPGLRYVQGMNELLSPLYHAFRSDASHAQHAEADAFFCFVELVSECRDNFTQQLDNSTEGIKATMQRFMHLLQAADSELYAHLVEANKVNAQFYAFRWITLLLTQEFPFPDVVRLWDALLAAPKGRQTALLRLCTAMLLHLRQQLLEGDFSQNLKMLQRYPPVDVNVLLAKAAELP